MDRNELIAERATSIQQELEVWASERGILKAGEQIRFTMEIVHTPLVSGTTEDHAQLRKMLVCDFFTRERLVAYGGPLSAKRITKGVEAVLAATPKIQTMEDFVKTFPSIRDFKRALDKCGSWLDFGDTVKKVMREAVTDAGFHFPRS